MFKSRHFDRSSTSDGRETQAYSACPFRFMWIISIPPRITRAVAIDLKPSIGRTRRLMPDDPVQYGC